MRSWKQIGFKRKKPEFEAEPKITASESSLWVSRGFCGFRSCGRGAGGGELPLQPHGGELGVYLQLSFTAEPPAELNQAYARGPS